MTVNDPTSHWLPETSVGLCFSYIQISIGIAADQIEELDSKMASSTTGIRDACGAGYLRL